MRKDDPWTTIAVPKSMMEEMNRYKKPFEPNYAFLDRLMKRFRK
jgi:hypothetical protein